MWRIRLVFHYFVRAMAHRKCSRYLTGHEVRMIFVGRQNRRTGGLALEEAKTIMGIALTSLFCKELVFLFEDYFTESATVNFGIVCDAGINQYILYTVGTRENIHIIPCDFF